jgi:hypothetical protein
MTHLLISSIKTIISFRKADLAVHNSLMSVCRVPGSVSGVACKDIAAQRERETTRKKKKKGFAFCFGSIVASLRPWRRALSLEIEKVY